MGTAEAYLRAAATDVERFLSAEVPPAARAPVWAAARHALVLDPGGSGPGGKRLRPALCLAACEACGGARADALPAAAALECVHTYSLVHDDLPSMDDDDLRRGRPACHVAFGIPTATRAGLALLALAFRTVARAYAGRPQGQEILLDLAAASGAEGMVGGQWLDVSGAGTAHDIEAVEAIHRRKTAALIAGAVVLGARASGASPERLAALRRAGEAAGLAFQVVDDILDVESSAAAMGKPVRADAAKGKTTVPAVLGLEGARARAAEHVRAAEAALAEAGAGASSLADLARFVAARRR